MRVAEYKQIDVNIITEEIEVDDVNEMGEVIGYHTETITKEVPIMGMVYRDETEEEKAERERIEREMPPMEITTDERIEMLESAIIELAEILVGGDE